MRVNDKMPGPEIVTQARLENVRYWILNYSVSAHCCFSSTVIDLHDGPDPLGQFGTVCETFTHENAVRICNALNIAHKGQPK